MNTTTDFARLPAENVGAAVVAVSTLVPDAGRQIDGAVAVVDSSIERGPERSARIVLTSTGKSRGIPELDSPMAG